jgi:type VI secretion system protein ImpC
MDEEPKSLLEKILINGKLVRDESQRKFAIELIKEFVNQFQGIQQKKNLKNIVGLINLCIQRIDELLSHQINEIIHDEEFLALEGSWRGLNYLVSNTETGPSLKLRLLNIKKEELEKDLQKAIDFDQSQLFKKIYEEEYGTFGGSPYSCLVGDFYFGRRQKDVLMMEKIASVAAAAHAPFITGTSPSMFDLDSFEQLSVPRDMAKLFENTELIKWNNFRKSDDARYMALTLPKVLIRQPYTTDSTLSNELNFEEDITGTDNKKFCWTNSAYILAQRITNAFSLYGWTAAIRGVEGGGIVEGLPSYIFKTIDGDTILKCPTQTTITDRREKELSNLGFISICHCKGTDYAAFFGSQTIQLPVEYNSDEASSNAQLAARLPYVLATSRFAHYIKVMMRDKVGSFLTKENVEFYLNSWIAGYVLLNDDATASVKATYPLREARIDVFDIDGKPGYYQCVVYLRPHFQMEELTASIRLVTTLPPPLK